MWKCLTNGWSEFEGGNHGFGSKRVRAQGQRPCGTHTNGLSQNLFRPDLVGTEFFCLAIIALVW